jgi:hypothetical protein
MSSIHDFEMLGRNFLGGAIVGALLRSGAETASFIGPERESFELVGL